MEYIAERRGNRMVAEVGVLKQKNSDGPRPERYRAT